MNLKLQLRSISNPPSVNENQLKLMVSKVGGKRTGSPQQKQQGGNFYNNMPTTNTHTKHNIGKEAQPDKETQNQNTYRSFN